MSIEAMKQALEALEMYINLDTHDEAHILEVDIAPKAITALRAAIEQAEKQEPVCEVLNERGEVDYISYVPPVGTPLYAAPRQWVGLTDEEIAGEFYKFEAAGAWYQFARAIEATLKEKNT